MSALLALWCSSALTACSSSDRLPAIPPPPPAPVVAVPVAVPLPVGMTEPCPKPAYRIIRTDVDLLAAADAFKVWGACNAAKLRAIAKALAPGA